MSLEEIAPTYDVLLALEPDELGLRLLPVLARPSTMPGEPLSLHGFLGRKFAPVYYLDNRVSSNSPYPTEHYRELKDAIAEAWVWLEGQGLLVPTLEPYKTSVVEFHPTNRRLSRRALRLAREPQLAIAARQLPKDVLHPLIRESVWAHYHRGKYSDAVFAAMKPVEVRVREATALPAALVGVKLMRAAFAPEGGPLTDMESEVGERVARMELFAGAIGSYKNPQSHRHVDLDDPNEAAEIVMIATHLLRIVDARAAARQPSEEA